MNLLNTFPLCLFLALSGCSETEQTTNTKNQTMNNSSNVQSTTTSDNFHKEGIVCIKKSGSMETTTYLGLITIGETLYTGIRTEKLIQVGGNSKDMGSGLILDDGKNSQVYSWNEGALIELPNNSKSAFPPSGISLTIEMGKRRYGDCISWDIDPVKFEKPKQQIK